jgi:hypothetical protein
MLDLLKLWRTGDKIPQMILWARYDGTGKMSDMGHSYHQSYELPKGPEIASGLISSRCTSGIVSVKMLRCQYIRLLVLRHRHAIARTKPRRRVLLLHGQHTHGTM